MSYVENNLLPGERVAFRTRLHRIIFLAPGIFSLIFFLLSAFVHPFAVVLLLPLAWLLVRFIEYFTSEFAVTDKRVIIKVGAVSTRTLELQLAKVETIAVNQGLIGKMAGYGDITVTGTGGSKERFKRVSAPLELRRAVQAGTG
ncbi:MAG: PH domain-containing protein [Proteobacteria bacterium]|nr:PH domain-containing protein [Pseudomonadota bacterium]